jgi:hypothetical protein
VAALAHPGLLAFLDNLVEGLEVVVYEAVECGALDIAALIAVPRVAREGWAAAG